VEELQTELGKKDSTLKTLKNQKSTTQQEWKFEMKQFEERMESLREELKKERDKSLKKTCRARSVVLPRQFEDVNEMT
jgi:peptidoglycan hydrolase CwlO-like protein